MTDYPKTARMLIYLLACAVNEKECRIPPAEIDFDGLYLLAKNHAVCSAVAFALESAGINDRRFSQAKLKAKRKLGLFDVERRRIYERLSEQEIWYLPLKGIVLKDAYPKYGMREMSDNDILCDSAKMFEVREVMESLGYTCVHFNKWNHDVYQKPPTLEFEMHHSLFMTDDTPALDSYYANVFDRLKHVDGCEYAFSDEDFYIYMVAHTYKHFSQNGTGLRSLLDIYVYLQTHQALDFTYMEREFEKLGILSFEQRCRRLAHNVFDLQRLNEEDGRLLSLFLNSSLYGSDRQREYNSITRQLDGNDTKRAKAKYFIDRVFLHGNDLEKFYPFFARHRWLLPVLYVYRPIKGLLTHPKWIIRDSKNVVKYRSPKDKF